MQIIRDVVKREYENKAIRISRIVDALEWLGAPSRSSITSGDGEANIRILMDAKNGEIEEAITNFVQDLTVAAAISKLTYAAMQYVKAKKTEAVDVVAEEG
jgi:hypothetical protein